jgi:hypothetical protein
MDQVKWLYYQDRKAHNYPVYIRFLQEDMNPKFSHLLQEMGFSALGDTEAKKIPLQRSNTRLLSVQSASPRVQREIQGSDLLEKYGPESLSLQAGVPVYTYRKVGLMALSPYKPLWDLAVHPELSYTDQMVGVRIILTRFLAQALAELGVLSYWGTVKDGTIIVMKQAQSFGEAVFIDLKERAIFSNGGELRLDSSLKILRKDKEVSTGGFMSREELISFLSVSTCLLSFNGITPAMRRAIYDLSTKVTATYALSEPGLNL